MIYNKAPILVMWDIVKSLKDEIPIYKETMDEDEDSTPDSYLLLESDIDDSPAYFADNTVKSRQSECNFLLVSKGVAKKSTDLHNVNVSKIQTALDTAGFIYTKRNLGYFESINSTQCSFSGTINYKL